MKKTITGLTSILAILLVSIFSVVTNAASGEFSSEGRLKVYKAFELERSYARTYGETVESKRDRWRIGPRVYNDFKLSHFIGNGYSPCIPPFCGNSRYDVPFLYIGYFPKSSNRGDSAASINVKAQTISKGKDSVLLKVVDQDVYLSVKKLPTKTEREDSVTEHETCYVEMYCHGHYGCTSAVGVRSVTRYNVITKKPVRVTFMNAEKELLATYEGIDTDSHSVVESVGQCHLNRDQYRY